MLLLVITNLLIISQGFFVQCSGNSFKRKGNLYCVIIGIDCSTWESFDLEEKANLCTNQNKISLGTSCLDKNPEFILTSEDLRILEKESISVNIRSCPSNNKQSCLNVDSQWVMGAGAHGVVVKGRSKSIPFPLAVKFIRLPTKLDLVSFNVQGRYKRIDLESLKRNQGNEKCLREAAALRLLTEYDVGSVPRFVADLESASYRILVMESLDGFDELTKHLDKLSPKELMTVSCQLGAIVCNFDRLGLAHDDLHERNILINRKNLQQVYVIDFGGAMFHGHMTSAGNFLKQPINLLAHLKRLLKDNLIDQIQSAERKTNGNFCNQMEKSTSKNSSTLAYEYQLLFSKHWKFQQNKNKLFKCARVSAT